MGIWRCSLRNKGGQTARQKARLTTYQLLESRGDIDARQKVVDSMYHREMRAQGRPKQDPMHVMCLCRTPIRQNESRYSQIMTRNDPLCAVM